MASKKDQDQAPSGKRTGRPNSGKAFAARQRRRNEADARDEAYRKLTREEKIARIEARPGESRRERERIS